jgi:Brp/Blh family beta-carotene 15,15'-monooxygenase
MAALFGFREDGRPGALVLPLAIAAMSIASTVPASATFLTPVACAFMLIIGLPHGMFDYLTLRKISGGSPAGVLAATAAYLGAAGLVWMVWQSAPFHALFVFVAIAICHFSEDWTGEQSRLGAAAMPISILALPALFYPAELSAIFVLIGGAGAGIMADYLRLLAPVFGLVAAANIAIDATSNVSHRAWRNASLLLAALLLPPGIGFAIYFCLYHSPIHFVEGRKRLMTQQRRPRHFFLGMSLASASLLLWIIVVQPFEAWDSRLIAATFQTLSILTVPHMLLPFAARGIKSRLA